MKRGNTLGWAVLFVAAAGMVSCGMPVEESDLLGETDSQLAGPWLYFPVDVNRGITRGYYAGHTGYDIDTLTNENVRAAAAGNVSFGSNSLAGNYAVVSHGNGYVSRYCHLNGFNGGARYVRAGDVIGLSGCTGDCTGDHLHFSLGQGGECLNANSNGVCRDPGTPSSSGASGMWVGQFAKNAAPAGADPIGVLDEVTSTLARGWACDTDSPSTSIQVHVYVGGPAGSGAPGYAVLANQASEAGVNTACRGGTAHRWQLGLSGSLSDMGKPVYAYGINVGGGGNSLLAGSPKTIPGCSGSGRSPTGVHDGNAYIGNGLNRAWGWACDQDAPGASIDVHVYVGGPAGSGAPGYAVRARLASEAAVNSICGGGTAHRWEFVYSGARVPVYAYGINVCGGGNSMLAATPR